MLTVHHLNNSRSQRILWMLEELDLAYDIRFYERDKITRLAPDALKAIHPLGKSPVITDGDFIMAETGAIIEYVLNMYGQGRFVPKAGTQAYLHYLHFLHYAEGSAMLPLLLRLYTNNILGVAAAPMAPTIHREIQTHFGYINDHLAGHDYFSGDDLSGADFTMIFPLEAARAGGALTRFTHVLNYVDKIQARPAYQRALKRGGDYAYGPAA